jgi:gamma-glutamyltranspeptidase/glutathione hydrolase
MRNVVASGHPRVTEIAAEVLRVGGNAFDAVVAAGFASAVAEPALTSLGGGGFLLARRAEGDATLFDFFVDVPGHGLAAGDLEPRFHSLTLRFPGSEQVFDVGMGAAAVPGVVRGYLHVHRRLGRLPVAEVLAPAITLAREGVPLTDRQAHVLDIVRPIWTMSAAGRRLLGADGGGAGAVLRNADLASFLESLNEDGDRELYEGELARRLVADMRAGGGQITEADLKAYRVVEREPLRDVYHGATLLTNPVPSFGGPLLVYSLRLLQACWPREIGFGTPGHLALLVSVLQEVDRGRGDPAFDLESAVGESLGASRERIQRAFGGTTHISVCDARGNVASMTTSNGEGCGYVVPGTGIMLNNMMGEDDLHPRGSHASPPGIRVASMMSPTLLLQGDSVRLALGSGGSKRIRTALLQVISNVLDFDMSLSAAVEAPRLHWDGTQVQIEPGFDASAVEALQSRWPVNRWSVRDLYFGGVHAASPTGAGAGDPRRGGTSVTMETT